MILTIDVEDWFCVRNMRYTLSEWNALELRVRLGLDFILNELRKRNIRATFFVLGWIAERLPEIVNDLRIDGHEIASHGYDHQDLGLKTPLTFEQDLKQSLLILSEQSKAPIYGYRAPSFSVTKDTLWALPILAREGLLYDSSIYPVHHPNYGIPGFSKHPTCLSGIVEYPLSVFNIGKYSLPISGGGYFRLFPYLLTRFLLKMRKETDPEVVLYFHPWEFDPLQPRVSLPWASRFRHYVGLSTNREKFKCLLDDFSFQTLLQSYTKGLPHAHSA